MRERNKLTFLKEYKKARNLNVLYSNISFSGMHGPPLLRKLLKRRQEQQRRQVKRYSRSRSEKGHSEACCSSLSSRSAGLRPLPVLYLSEMPSFCTQAIHCCLHKEWMTTTATTICCELGRALLDNHHVQCCSYYCTVLCNIRRKRKTKSSRKPEEGKILKIRLIMQSSYSTS